MDNTIKVRDIIEYCESAAESMSRLADKAINSMGKEKQQFPPAEQWHISKIRKKYFGIIFRILSLAL